MVVLDRGENYHGYNILSVGAQLNYCFGKPATFVQTTFGFETGLESIPMPVTRVVLSIDGQTHRIFVERFDAKILRLRAYKEDKEEYREEEEGSTRLSHIII
jgi:hypothetical protein